MKLSRKPSQFIAGHSHRLKLKHHHVQAGDAPKLALRLLARWLVIQKLAEKSQETGKTKVEPSAKLLDFPAPQSPHVS